MTITNHNGIAVIGLLIRILAQQFLKFCLYHLANQLLAHDSDKSVREGDIASRPANSKTLFFFMVAYLLWLD